MCVCVCLVWYWSVFSLVEFITAIRLARFALVVKSCSARLVCISVMFDTLLRESICNYYLDIDWMS